MEVERDSLKLSLSNDLIKAARFLSMEAHKGDLPYLTNTMNHVTASSSSSTSSSSSLASSLTEVVIVAFAGLWKVNDWYRNDDQFGLTDVDSDLFPSLRRIGENRLAKVNAAFLQRFQHLLNNSAIESEVEKAVVKDRKMILFTGHSSGGAIASFATLWMLDEHVKKRGNRFPIGCVTFGSPLIGDRTISHAVQREKWAGCFTHFVMEHDIVPRIMLSPKKSIHEHLPNFLNFFKHKLKATTTSQRSHISLDHLENLMLGNTIDEDLSMSIATDESIFFFKKVMINASTVANYAAYYLMQPTDSLIDNLSNGFVNVSPYRPFGLYVFCTRRPVQLLLVENPDAVLQLFYYFLLLHDANQELADFCVDSVAESLSYEDLELEFLVDLKELNDYLVTPNGQAHDWILTRIKSLLNLGLSERCCLIAAEKSEERKKENEKQIDKFMRSHGQNSIGTKFIIEDLLDEIRKYKQSNLDYYDAFKLHDRYEDFEANMNRLELARLWDKIVEMVMREDLPDGFEGREEWVVVGTEFRRLVEPLDIGNFYRHLFGMTNYMHARPRRYKFTQRWYEHAHVTRFELVSESNFVAQLEEFMKEVEGTRNRTFEEVTQEVESVEERVQMWFDDGNIRNEDVFWGETLLYVLRGKLQQLAL